MGILRLIVAFVRAFFVGRVALAVENLALRQQLIVLQRSVKRPKVRRGDRIFWSWLSGLWSGWKSALLIVQPGTVTGWHRQGFRLYWRWKSRKKRGRPLVDREIRDLIRRGSDKEDQERRERLWLLNGRDDEEYNRHLSNMHKTVVRRRGRVEYVWMPIHSGARTDLRDCEVYQIAGAYMAQVHLLPPQEQIDRLRQEIVDQKRRSAARNSPPSEVDAWTPRPL